MHASDCTPPVAQGITWLLTCTQRATCLQEKSKVHTGTGMRPGIMRPYRYRYEWNDINKHTHCSK